MNKTICIVVQDRYDFDTRVRRKAEALVAAGYSVDVLALSSGRDQRCYQLEGVNVRTIRLGKKRGSLLRYGFEYLAFLIWVFWRVHLQTWQRRYAVVDINTLPDFLVFSAALTPLLDARVILDMHEITPEFYISKYGVARDSAAVRVMTFLERVSMRFAHHVITITEPVQRLLETRGLPPGRSTVMMNAADDRVFATLRPAVLDKRSDRPFVMMYHGTLTSIYGLDIAIEALQLAASDMPLAELWILGDGPERDALARLAVARGIESRVRFLGVVQPGDIPAWLDKSDVGVLPLRHDALLEYAFPNKLPEYIVSGKPVIISRLRTIAHYFSDDAVAFCKPADPADLAVVMRRLYDDRGLCRRLAAQATTEYQPIRWDVMKQRYLKLIAAMVGSDRAAIDAGMTQSRPLVKSS